MKGERFVKEGVMTKRERLLKLRGLFGGETDERAEKWLDEVIAEEVREIHAQALHWFYAVETIAQWDEVARSKLGAFPSPLERE